MLPIEASSELLLKALRELLRKAPKGVAMELLQVAPYTLHVGAP